MINRLIEPTSGKIYINGKDIAAQDRVELRRHIGYVIQQIGLFPNMTVAQNICVVPNLLKYSKEACDKIVHELLSTCPMSSTPTSTPPRCPAGSSSASVFSVPWRPRPPSC
jgi:osmoprotectant transport system ATP-binding protein